MTSTESKISEVVEIVVGNLSFMVIVEEKGLTDHLNQPRVGTDNSRKLSEKLNHDIDSTSESSSKTSLSPLPVMEGSWQEVEDDGINAVLVGKEFSECYAVENCMGNSLGEEELMGMGLKVSQTSGVNVEINGCLKEGGVRNGPILEEKAHEVLEKRWAGVIEEIKGKTCGTDCMLNSSGLEAELNLLGHHT
ncbi:hypothetical protein V6N13_109680 [Hibiscus sabdariffa]|uniref:Uncharacterized protein n=1 Tax=Hibiscus sabdariffa TaxID=183260 RepID=A0ABR2FQA2_9ROSI